MRCRRAWRFGSWMGVPVRAGRRRAAGAAAPARPQALLGGFQEAISPLLRFMEHLQQERFTVCRAPFAVLRLLAFALQQFACGVQLLLQHGACGIELLLQQCTLALQCSDLYV